MTYTEQQRGVEVINWGLISYKEAWEKQELLFNELVRQKLEDRKLSRQTPTKNYLIFCEHPLVYTLGKSGSIDHLLLNEEELTKRGIEFYKTNRGGDITHHGPGQQVVYPIFDLENFFTDIHLYLRKLEQSVIQLLADFNIKAERFPKYTGVWIEPDSSSARKICAMGVKCSRWVTMHGIALNVNNDLSLFENIIPCGIEDKAVTSIKKEIGRELPPEGIIASLKHYILKEFDAFEIEN